MKTPTSSPFHLVLATACIGLLAACARQPATAEAAADGATPATTAADAMPAPNDAEAELGGPTAADAAAPTNTATAAAPDAAAADPSATTTAAAAADKGGQGVSAWNYGTRPSSSGEVATASITSTDGSNSLSFEQHPVTGRAVFLQPPADVDCPTGCKVSLQVDGQPAQEMRASRPESTPPRLSLRDPRGLWNALAHARAVTITYPGASGPVTTQFDVQGLDASRLHGWEQ